MSAHPTHLIEVHPNNPGWELETFFDSDGRLHRVDGPAVIAYDADGDVREESYFLNGTCARIGGPAKIVHSGGRRYGKPWWGRRSEEWVWDGCTSRLDGPALLAYTITETTEVRESIEESRWFLDAEELPDGRSELVAATTGWTDERLLDELGRTRYAAILGDVVDPRAVVAAIAAGVDTVEGMRAVLGGAPAEWALAFESGEALGFGSSPGSRG